MLSAQRGELRQHLTTAVPFVGEHLVVISFIGFGQTPGKRHITHS